MRDEKFRKNMIDNGRTEEICRQIDDLAEEDHTTIGLQQRLTITEVIGAFKKKLIHAIRHRSDFK